MRKYSLPVFLFFTCVAIAPAQDHQKVEIFGGYSHLRPETQVPALVPSGYLGAGHGVAASAAFNLTETFGIGIDWSRHWFERVHYGSPRFLLPDGRESFYYVDAKQGRQDFFIGPRLRILKQGRLSASVKAGVGAIGWSSDHRTDQPGLNEGEPMVLESDATTWKFAASFGGSLDLELSKNLSWRVVQPEVIYWRQGENHIDLKVSTGLVFRFGGR